MKKELKNFMYLPFGLQKKLCEWFDHVSLGCIVIGQRSIVRCHRASQRHFFCNLIDFIFELEWLLLTERKNQKIKKKPKKRQWPGGFASTPSQGERDKISI